MEQQIDTYLTFSLGTENFAIDVSHVEKILEFQPVTKVPKAPDFMLGVFNLRGEVIPLIDTRLKFGMDAITITNATCVLVITVEIDGEPIKLGALVDNVKEVIKIEKENIMPLPSVGKQNKAEFIKGVFRNESTFFLLFNADKIFSVEEVTEIKAENFDLESMNN
jgi:purine-binding chemotaxis protein CheW